MVCLRRAVCEGSLQLTFCADYREEWVTGSFVGIWSLGFGALAGSRLMLRDQVS